MGLSRDLEVGDQVRDYDNNVWTIVAIDDSIAYTHEWLPDYQRRNSFIFRFDTPEGPWYNVLYEHVDQN